MADKLYSLNMLPGIKKDGTQFSSRNYIDGEWVRFQRGLPRKIGGYKVIGQGNTGKICRGVYIVPFSPNFNIYIGDSGSLKYLPFDSNGNKLGEFVDRTPVNFVDNEYNVWDFDTMFSTISNSSIIVAHAAPNLFSIDNNVDSPIFYGDADTDSLLTPTGISVSGGVAVFHPYLFMFGNSGDVSWSEANDPTRIMGSARVSSQKIVAGLATRGGNSSPAGLLWSLDAVIRVTEVGSGSIDFKFDTITTESSILSSRSIIEYDGTYFWAAADRFLCYNGVIQEVENTMNLNYFFDNLNYAQRQKVWATKITRFGEIWWHFPTGTNTECDSAVIYNVREKTWYNTSSTRSAGYFDQVFTYPVWTESTKPELETTYSIDMHEIGTDAVISNTDIRPIYSYFETGDIAWCGVGPDGQMQGIDRWVDLYRIEPDFIQDGDMDIVVNGRQYARSNVTSSDPYIFSPTTEKIDLREQRREMTLKFESNVVGGNYEMGQILLAARIGDARQ